MEAIKRSEELKKYEEKLEEAKKPKIINKLDLGDGEVYLGKLTNADKYQVLVRHINVLEQRLELIAQFTSISAICLEELCKEKGINIDKIINKK